MYTWLNLTFTIDLLAQYMHNPEVAHIIVCKHNFCYTQGTFEYYIKYCRNPIPKPPFGFSNANWGGDINQQQLTFEYCYILLQRAMSWKSLQQKSTALSSTEAQYMAMAITPFEVVWLQHLPHDL